MNNLRSFSAKARRIINKNYAGIIFNDNYKYFIRGEVVRGIRDLDEIYKHNFSWQETNLYNREDSFISDTYEGVIENIFDTYQSIIGANFDHGDLNIYGYGGVSLGFMPVAGTLSELFKVNPIKIDSNDLEKYTDLRFYYNHLAVIKLSFPVRYGRLKERFDSYNYNYASRYNAVKFDQKDSNLIPKGKYMPESEVFKIVEEEMSSFTFDDLTSNVTLQ